MKDAFRELIKPVENDIVAFRRYLHQYPERSGEEWNTSRFVQEKLTEYGIPFEKGFADTGVLGIIKGEQPGGTVALRADMDALPITEQAEVDYRSEVDGVMHACGHDAHTSMLLGTGYALNQLKEQLAGTVLLVFQPAEENSPTGGAGPMLDDGVFEQYEPDVIYGQHVWPTLPVGQVGIRDQEMMGASDRFTISVKGKGGHASMPQDGNDAIIMANQIITSLQTIVSRNVDPIESAVVTVGSIHGGYAHNVIADKVTLEGTVRTYKPAIKERVKHRFHKIVENVAEAFEGSVEIEYLDGYPSTINTPEWAEVARGSARTVLGEDSTPEVQPVLAGEDFSRFLERYPGAFIWLGTRIESEEDQMGLHDPKFMLNEKALPGGSATMAQIAYDTLLTLQGGGGSE
ncbi:MULTISPECIES: M20 metallopeptidase family protein [Pontibacillus]|uniref:M20 family metallopeptidase n=1 Tax=Pontibacillus chungwhensis TaxID=265426 RepID=A0ABY8UVK5_9BACI|nr:MULTISPECIES: M20 family metallopeptidase [Pontibacillus]MCD5324232.1 M20 family metallopeptidase [Pontibacillus sp. HN14]WIF97712.1 M20 family metallopeptidase [Pontibacillus chungwhensis]